MRSLRRTALVWMTALLTGVAATAVVIAYAVARNEAASFLDGQLRQIALNAGDGLPESAGPPVPHDPEDDFIIEIRGAAGERLRSSPLGADLPGISTVGFATVTLGGEDWRVYTSSDGRRTVRVAQRMSVRREVAEGAAIQAATPILAVIPLAWLVIGWSLRRVLGPLGDLARTIAERGVDSKEPLPTAGVPVEVAPIVESMNLLIERLRRALDQQTRFVADAAHELRTPLAALQLQIDNLGAATTLDGPRSAELAGGIRRAAALLEQLLRMARFDAPVEPARRETVDLAALATECVADHVAIAADKGVDLGIVARDVAATTGVPGECRILVGNLIDNAVRYTPAGGTVDVSVRVEDSRAVLEVRDTGPGIAEAALPHVFDRFFRAAPPGIEGSGLGLAIVAAIARRHGATALVENRRDAQGLVARVSFALDEAPERPAPD